MKYRVFVLLAAFTFMSSVFLSCEKEEDNNMLPVTSTGLTDTLKTGKWKVSYFWDKDKDETYHFTGYVFVFNADGTVIATKGDVSVSGTWAVQNSGNSMVEFVLNFGAAVPFDELEDDWNVKKMSPSKIELEDISGGSGEIEYLHFEKM